MAEPFPLVSLDTAWKCRNLEAVPLAMFKASGIRATTSSKRIVTPHYESDK